MIEQAKKLAALARDHDAVLKMAFLLALVLVLLIPLDLIGGLIAERMARRDAVVTEINQTWGLPQTFAGPVLILPYRYTPDIKKWDQSEPREIEGTAFFLPDELRLVATLEPEARSRSLFETTVYRAGLQVSGRFGDLDLGALGLDAGDMLWSKAVLAVGLTDLRGTSGEPAVSWQGAMAAFRPGTGSDLWSSGMHAPVPLDLDDLSSLDPEDPSSLDPEDPSSLDPEDRGPLDFAFDVTLAGSANLSFTPLGKTTHVAVTSPWPHPSFDGATLPGRRQVTGEGFTADWNLSYLGRGYPQSWTTENAQLAALAEQHAASRFGVSLVTPVDLYLLSERSIKHGALFIVLIFTAIFIFEFMTPARIHVVQYALVGFALCLFYLLLLSLAEVVGFGAAFAGAAGLSTALVTFYMAKVLASARRAAPIAGLLGAVYLYLYILLQLESLALVTGAAGLFAALAAVMYATRDVDWYALKRA